MTDRIWKFSVIEGNKAKSDDASNPHVYAIYREKNLNGADDKEKEEHSAVVMVGKLPPKAQKICHLLEPGITMSRTMLL